MILVCMGSRRHAQPTLLLAAVGLSLWSTANSQPASSASLTLEVATRARTLQPGEVVLVSIVPSRPLIALEGIAFDHAVSVWQDGASRWQALAGIPLDTGPGTVEIVLRAKSVAGETTSTAVAITVAAANFETRRLKVAEQFVNPPKSVLPRITKETDTVAEVFAGSQPERIWRGPFRVPVAGRSTSAFGRLSILNGISRGRHQGADFRAATGTPVVAPNAGRIALVADHYFSGRTVVVDHGAGLLSLFAHFSQIAVKTGTLVKGGQKLGEAGATGRVTGPHVHWTVRLRGVAIDPLSLIAALEESDERDSRSVR
jgi:murein DD-endopeptidase MepM/ murein hydrolase activator NlpD